jgi:hypothetical protein
MSAIAEKFRKMSVQDNNLIYVCIGKIPQFLFFCVEMDNSKYQRLKKVWYKMSCFLKGLKNINIGNIWIKTGVFVGL